MERRVERWFRVVFDSLLGMDLIRKLMPGF